MLVKDITETVIVDGSSQSGNEAVFWGDPWPVFSRAKARTELSRYYKPCLQRLLCQPFWERWEVSFIQEGEMQRHKLVSIVCSAITARVSPWCCPSLSTSKACHVLTFWYKHFCSLSEIFNKLFCIETYLFHIRNYLSHCWYWTHMFLI